MISDDAVRYGVSMHTTQEGVAKTSLLRRVLKITTGSLAAFGLVLALVGAVSKVPNAEGMLAGGIGLAFLCGFLFLLLLVKRAI